MTNDTTASAEMPALPARGWYHWLPGLHLLRHYPRQWFAHDMVAGLVLTAMLIPVGIAYAEASGVPGIYGLYATVVPLLAYALFGPSRIMVIGPDAALSPIILAVVVAHAAGDATHAIAVAGMMAIVAGLVCIGAGLLKLGFLTELLSTPIRHGYMNGIAVSVLLSQLPKLAGFTIESDGPLHNAWQILVGFVSGAFHPATLLLGLGTLAIIVALKPFRRLPGVLIAVIASTLVVALWGKDSGISVLGVMPQGLPQFSWPVLAAAEFQSAIIGGITVALVAFADASVLSRAYAAKLRVPVNPNQEIIGLGAANLAAGLFQAFPISSSSTRTPVAEAAGSRSQMTGIVGALVVLLLLVLAPDLLQYLPDSTLAAVVIMAAISLFEVRDLQRIYRVQQWEFWLSMLCFAGVLWFGAIPGIGIAVAVAIAEFLWDAWRPHFTVLGHVDGLHGFHDIERHPEATQLPGLLLFRWDAPLFFANAGWFQSSVLDAVAQAPTPLRQLIVAAEPVTSIDVTSADMLAELQQQLQDRGIALHFAEMKGPVKDKLKRFGLASRFVDRLHPTVESAVASYCRQHGLSLPD